jgi:hypothetical protein
MTEISERQAGDIDRIADMLTEQLVSAATRFCAHHELRDEHDAPLASLIMLEAVTLNVLSNMFDTDLARHQTLTKMHKAMHLTLRQMAQARAAIHPPYDDR